MPNRELSAAAVDRRHSRYQCVHPGATPGRPAALIIGHARAGNIRIDISAAILDETIRVLRDKFQWNGYVIQDARHKLLALGNYVAPSDPVDIVKEDPDDDRILECAAAANSDFIVTEDKDLLRLRHFSGAQIVTIREFLNSLDTSGTIRRRE